MGGEISEVFLAEYENGSGSTTDRPTISQASANTGEGHVRMSRIVITGAPGAGKTTLLLALLDFKASPSFGE